jgi:hypothetical protein
MCREARPVAQVDFPHGLSPYRAVPPSEGVGFLYFRGYTLVAEGFQRKGLFHGAQTFSFHTDSRTV